MFSNIGKSIKHIAKTLFVLGIIGSIVYGATIFITGCLSIRYLWWMLFLAPIATIVGVLLTWFAFLLLYGYGQMIEDVHAMRQAANIPDEDEEKAKRDEEERLKRIEVYTKNHPVTSSYTCKCGTRFYGDTCPGCGRTIEQNEREQKAEKVAEKKAIIAEKRESEKTQKRIQKYSSKHTIKNLQPKEETVSHICECGERFYGKTCPICGRTLKDK